MDVMRPRHGSFKETIRNFPNFWARPIAKRKLFVISGVKLVFHYLVS